MKQSGNGSVRGAALQLPILMEYAGAVQCGLAGERVLGDPASPE